jgi:2-polyprenyl-3-methyl-5-hydroxy-6-metoxy-1,4-benzoquinol methylase
MLGKDHQVEYVEGWGETFSLNEKFDTITMNNILEHVDDPVEVLTNCKRHLADKGRIIVQVPNSRSITRRLGLVMGIIPNLLYISDKERDYYGHKRAYVSETLLADVANAKLNVAKWGGLLWKPLPNETLLELCQKQGKGWTDKFIQALLQFGENRPDECANLYVVCQ